MKNWYHTSAVCFFGFLSCLSGLADPATPRSNEPDAAQSKPYTLFMGTDVSVEWKGKFYPIKDVTEKGFLIDVDGRRVIVSSDSNDFKFQGANALKVAPTGIAISKVEFKRAYTPANDPQRIAAANAAGMSAKMESERYHADVQIAKMGIASSTSQTTNGPDPKAAMPGLTNDYNRGQGTMLADASFSTGINNDFDGENESGGSYDALRLSFDISSPTPATGTYLVLVIKGRDMADKTNPDRVWILGEKIGNIGSEAKTVRLFRGGFPAGYTLTGVSVHLYDERAELATNIAPNHTEITTDEAFQISVVEYTRQHRGADVQPVEATAGQTAKVGARLSADQHGRTYYVKVNKNGLPGDAFMDETCSQKVTEASLTSAISSLRYYPALKAGKPVESVVPVRL
jgi:hypothetical protein